MKVLKAIRNSGGITIRFITGIDLYRTANIRQCRSVRLVKCDIFRNIKLVDRNVLLNPS